MNTVLLIIAVFIFITLFVSDIDYAVGNRTIKFLKDIPPVTQAGCPPISIIFAARNEERDIKKALLSLLRQGYRGELEIIAVNDRSTDGTGQILDELAATEPKLQVIDITDLPQGWMGKSYALYKGSQSAGGEYLLFTDADVIMTPSTVSRAVNYLLDKGLDHLAITPEMKSNGLILNMLIGTFMYLFILWTKPWWAKKAKSRWHIGIGAFNLLKAETYQSIGTHKAIAMRPDDDMKLGKLVKKNGFKQDILLGAQMMHLQWYTSVKDMVMGLAKNAFAGLGYSVTVSCLCCLGILLMFVLPFIAVCLTDGPLRIVSACIIILVIASYADTAGYYGLTRWHGITLPFTTLLLIYIICNSMISALANKGIYWRDTYYPLKDLKAGRV